MSQADIDWADLVFVMERKHRSQLRSRFSETMAELTVHVLEVPDEYEFMDPELIELLVESVRPLLEEP